MSCSLDIKFPRKVVSISWQVKSFASNILVGEDIIVPGCCRNIVHNRAKLMYTFRNVRFESNHA